MEIVQDTDKAISVMHEVALWMEESGMKLGPWWDPENMNRRFLLKHTEPGEYYVVIENGRPAASVILEDTERNQSWKSIDGDNPKKALYIHWLCVTRDFSAQGYSNKIIDFAAEEATKRGFSRLRLDTDAEVEKLCKLYEALGFNLMGIQKEENNQTAFYQKEI